MYLRGSGGGIWYHAADHPSQLQEYAQVQLRAGDLERVEEPANAYDLNVSLRPRDSAPKSRWAAYITNAFSETVSPNDQATMTRQELIDWADELEAEAEEADGKKGSKK